MREYDDAMDRRKLGLQFLKRCSLEFILQHITIRLQDNIKRLFTFAPVKLPAQASRNTQKNKVARVQHKDKTS